MNFESLTRTELIAARIQCDISLLFFTRFWFRVLRGTKFIISDHHKIIEQNLKLIEDYELLLLNINIPPRFSKTEIAAVNVIARGIGMNPCSNWLYITASDELRAQTSVSIRDIVQHPYFNIMYGVELKRDQNGKNLWRTDKGGGLKTATIFGQITGFGAGQMIEHDSGLTDYIRDFEGCIVLDDINKIDDASQENAINEKVSRVLLNTVLSRVNSKDTPIINIQQRAGAKDATAVFQDYFGESTKAKFLVMPVIYPDGRLLWEWKCGHEEIERLKSKSPTTFETQYMQNPEPKEGLLLPISSLRFDDLSKIDRKLFQYSFACGDPADRGGDNYAMPFMFVDFGVKKLTVYVKDVICNKVGIIANTPNVVSKLTNYGIDDCIVESNGVGMGAVVDLHRSITGNTKLIPLSEHKNKEGRILASYEFVRDNFVFDSNYKNNVDYSTFIKCLTSYQTEGDNKHIKDPIDACCGAAAFLKAKFKSVLY